MSKTIVDKLNLLKYKKVVVLDMPEGGDYFIGLPEYDTEFMDKGYDLIFAFVLRKSELKKLMDLVIEKNYLNENGYIYIAYPKKGNKVYPSYIHRDELFETLGADEEGYVGTSNIKFARMVGLDEIFTVVGLKDENRNKKSKSSKASQCVDDYIAMIPDIEKDLQDNKEILSFYQSLTPGYQKDWARYIYSAKQEVTKEKRREEMKMILGAGYKTRELYRNR
ncbi:YdeI/OmpD-associated family protein [Bacillus sp. 1P10SD]|uniref:YdeI/OmpD-associated family protein n=1 Tax=Bacillus sp. 1P10SD TaxID=3132265 RepID=UPI0039A4C91E